MAVLKSYDLNGEKLSFANWVSDITPWDTPFISMTNKVSIDQTLFQWQNDSLSPAKQNALMEGHTALPSRLHTTTVHKNYTQILGKVVQVSDTTDVMQCYGRKNELLHQLEKASKELKRDLEWAFLNNDFGRAEDGPSNSPRLTAGFSRLLAPAREPDPATGAITTFRTEKSNILTDKDIFRMTYNLYLSGSRANIIMFHPKWASMFSALQEKTGGGRVRIFEDTPQFSVLVNKIVDPLGQEYKLIPNRYMPERFIYFFHPDDWTQMVLRAPNKIKLSKDGSYQKWMIEMEVGLRSENEYGSGCLAIDHSALPQFGADLWKKAEILYTNGSGTSSSMDISSVVSTVEVSTGSKLSFKVQTNNSFLLPSGVQFTCSDTDSITMVLNGFVIGSFPGDGSVSEQDLLLTSSAQLRHEGEFFLQYKDSTGRVVGRTEIVTISIV